MAAPDSGAATGLPSYTVLLERLSLPHPQLPPPHPSGCVAQEWDDFIAALKRQLPITFRINGQGSNVDRLREKLQGEFLGQFTEEPVVVSS